LASLDADVQQDKFGCGQAKRGCSERFLAFPFVFDLAEQRGISHCHLDLTPFHSQLSRIFAFIHKF